MTEAKIPIIPGMMKSGKEVKGFKEAAEKIGYPVMIKASAGGGGKGMRIIRSPKDLDKGIEAGMREAKSAFGDESVYLEKYIEEPRHVEFQVLADNSGNVVHLCERECSIQRRHQKIVEETPSCALDESLRAEMGEVARKAIKVSGYNNAGTVEFLLDKNKNFYFLEVNDRSGSGKTADKNSLRRKAFVHPGGYQAKGSRHRMQNLCGGPGEQLFPFLRQDPFHEGTLWPRRQA
jgi:acetyl/propionyl-CoA carboxylase alpha subunit